MLQSKNVVAIMSFIFEDILCQWDTISELVTNNGSPLHLGPNYFSNVVWDLPCSDFS